MLAWACHAPATAGENSVAPRSAFSADELKRIYQLSPLPAPPVDPSNGVASSCKAAALGQRMFFDKNLSAHKDIACASCHDPVKGWADGRALSHGIADGKRNTPSLWNVAFNRWYFWDGRADSLWSQALKPIEDKAEMGGNRLAIARYIEGDPDLRERYEEVFGALPTLAPENSSGSEATAVNRIFADTGKAIAAFEAHIVSGHSPFDVYVEGLKDGDPAKLSAMSESAVRGLRLFVGKGNCTLCHNGPNFTDGAFHDLGVVASSKVPATDSGRFDGVKALLKDEYNLAGPYSDDASGASADKVRYVLDGPANWGQVKTPSLRNVAQTAPYMHQGQLGDLRSVIEVYSELQGVDTSDPHREQVITALHLSEAQIDDLTAFLRSLSEIKPDERLSAPGTLTCP